MNIYRAIYREVKGADKGIAVDRYSDVRDTPKVPSIRESMRLNGMEPVDSTTGLDDIYESGKPFYPRSYWVGTTPASLPDFVSTRPGVLRAERTYSGGPFARLAQFVTGRGMVVSLELGVKQSERRQGIGTAMAYTALGAYRQQATSRIDIPAGTEGLSEWAVRYGYQPVSSGTEDVLRFEAQVGDVRRTMEETQPWLLNPVVETRGSLVDPTHWPRVA